MGVLTRYALPLEDISAMNISKTSYQSTNMEVFKTRLLSKYSRPKMLIILCCIRGNLTYAKITFFFIS